MFEFPRCDEMKPEGLCVINLLGQSQAHSFEPLFLFCLVDVGVR